MATKNNFSLIRGKKMRVTRLTGCGVPAYGDADGTSAVSSGFVSVAFTGNTTDAETIDIINANGQTCASDTTSPTFNSYGLEITFCGVQPCLFEMLTGQKPVLDAHGEAVGFRMNSKVDLTGQAFALELWAGVPGVACSSDTGGSYGYVLVPFVSSGVVGDFTIENAAANFVVTGATTKDGNGWGAGPYEVVPDAGGEDARLPTLVDPNDHLLVQWTSVAPPPDTEGCVVLAAPTVIPITGVTAGTPGSFVPGNADRPANLAALKAHAVIGDTGTNKPTAAWESGQYVVLGDLSWAHWSGTAWAAGAHA